MPGLRVPMLSRIILEVPVEVVSLMLLVILLMLTIVILRVLLLVMRLNNVTLFGPVIDSIVAKITLSFKIT